jgi:hypothetical protein
MTPLWLGLVFLLTVHENDIHLFPNQAYTYGIYCGLRLEKDLTVQRYDPQAFVAVAEGMESWGHLHAAWMCWPSRDASEESRQGSLAAVRRHLFRLRCRIGWGAYSRGEIPIPAVRINP